MLMKKRFIIYEQFGKTKKAVLDENMYSVYLKNPEIKNIREFSSELLMEKEYGKNQTNNKKMLLG